MVYLTKYCEECEWYYLKPSVSQHGTTPWTASNLFVKHLLSCQHWKPSCHSDGLLKDCMHIENIQELLQASIIFRNLRLVNFSHVESSSTSRAKAVIWIKRVLFTFSNSEHNSQLNLEASRSEKGHWSLSTWGSFLSFFFLKNLILSLYSLPSHVGISPNYWACNFAWSTGWKLDNQQCVSAAWQKLPCECLT